MEELKSFIDGRAPVSSFLLTEDQQDSKVALTLG